MRYAVVSGEYRAADELLGYGIMPLFTQKNDDLQTEISFHADMNCANVGGRIFVAGAQKKLIENMKKIGIKPTVIDEISPKYPDDVALNLAIFGNTAIYNPQTLCKPITEALSENYTLYPVRQGYTGCATLFVNEKAVITTDDGIKSSLENMFDICKISSCGIHLCDKYNGFIGGSAKMISPYDILFFGDVTKHPDYREIERFLHKYNVKIHCLSGELCDIGGMIFL